MQKENQLKSCGKKMLSSREVVARDLPHPTMLSLLNRKQQPYFMREAEDPGTLRAAKLSGMTPNFKGVGPGLRPSGAPLRSGFTLIELLVVVLIIGILAAVALPQYQKAVEKSKAVQAQTLVKTVYDAAQAYKLATGNWPTNFDELAVEIPWTGNTSVMTPTYYRIRSNNDWSLVLAHSDNMNGIWVIRNSGAYMYAGFVMRESDYTIGSVVIPGGKLLCVEGSVSNGFTHTFNQDHSTGDYCRKIMKGTEIPSNSANRFFTL